MRIQIRDKYFFIRVGQHRTGPIPASRPKQPPSGRDGGRTAANSSVSANFFSSFILSQKVLGENSDVFFSVFSLVPEKFQNPFPWSSVQKTFAIKFAQEEFRDGGSRNAFPKRPGCLCLAFRGSGRPPRPIFPPALLCNSK